MKRINVYPGDHFRWIDGTTGEPPVVGSEVWDEEKEEFFSIDGTALMIAIDNDTYTFLQHGRTCTLRIDAARCIEPDGFIIGIQPELLTL